MQNQPLKIEEKNNRKEEERGARKKERGAGCLDFGALTNASTSMVARLFISLFKNMEILTFDTDIGIKCYILPCWLLLVFLNL